MPRGELRYKAGKITFLLVCLFFLTACGSEEAVFQAGEAVVPVTPEAAAEPSQKPPVTRVPETEVPETEVPETEMPETEMPETEAPASGRININTASARELMTLPGIGESRAAAVIDYRVQTGEFQSIEEIMNVKGIGTGIFSKISSLICVK